MLSLPLRKACFTRQMKIVLSLCISSYKPFGYLTSRVSGFSILKVSISDVHRFLFLQLDRPTTKLEQVFFISAKNGFLVSCTILD